MSLGKQIGTLRRGLAPPALGPSSPRSEDFETCVSLY